ncbi:MAG: hypothetical protein IKA30_00505, partial [Alphaproteobacteria bacterium]|nr:hypothetical protein [Alphaproteobacteria bacterium]
MKKNIFVICMLHAMFVSHELWASWEIVYQNVKDTYVDNITIQEIASSALKGLSNADKNLTVGGGVNTITLYYKGRVIDTVNTPDDNANKWAEITKRFIDKSLEKSSVASQNDFMIFDMVAGEIPKALDGDSKFFENFDEANDITNKNKRTFAYRVNENVLTVKIVAFNKQTVNELKKAIAENENVDALILDLRGCAGGMSSEAIKTADLFLDSGIIASTKG